MSVIFLLETPIARDEPFIPLEGAEDVSETSMRVKYHAKVHSKIVFRSNHYQAIGFLFLSSLQEEGFVCAVFA